MRQAVQRGLEASIGPGPFDVRSQYSDVILQPAVVERLQDTLYARRVRRVQQLNGNRPGRVLRRPAR